MCIYVKFSHFLKLISQSKSLSKVSKLRMENKLCSHTNPFCHLISSKIKKKSVFNCELNPVKMLRMPSWIFNLEYMNNMQKLPLH